MTSSAEQLAAVAAHDLRGHLLGIAGYAQLLARAVPADPAALEMAEQICLGAESGVALVDELLVYATCLWRPVIVEPVDLDQLVAGLVEDDAVHVGPLGTVMADPVLVRHLVRHLLSNALLYVEAGMRAEIHVSATDAADGRRHVRVRDHGIGIALADRETVFEPFQRGSGAGRHRGSGLGLAICREAVTRCGGQIGIEDSPYGGTTMIFTLPSTGGS